MAKVRWYHHVLCALFGHHWTLFWEDTKGIRTRNPWIDARNTCRRCLTPITETEEGILE